MDPMPYYRNPYLQTPPSIHSRPSRQGGVATILIVLLVGVSLTATVLGVMYYIHSTQSQLLSVHAQTQAQMRAWTGVEAVRKYLEGINSNNKLVALAQQIGTSGNNLTLSITGLNGVTASLVGVDSDTDPKSFTALISGVAADGTAAESNSSVKVVFTLTSGGGGSSTEEVELDGADFNRNLRSSGGITVVTEKGSAFTITVNGDFTTGGNSIEGVSTIRSTGSISIGSGSSYEELHANCDVVLTGSVTAARIKARRNACLTGGAAGTESITVNGTVLGQAGYEKNGVISAIGNSTDVSACREAGASDDATNFLAATCSTLQQGLVVDLGFGAAGANGVKAKGNVNLASGRIGELLADGNLLLANWGAKVDSGTIGGVVVANNPDMKKSINVLEHGSPNVSIASVPRVTMETYIIDAYDYKAIANYVFHIDSNGFKKVTVHNVSGINDGDYFLGNFNENYADHKDYLCPSLTSDSTKDAPVCDLKATPSSNLNTICSGYSTSNTCFDYGPDSKTWSINGKSMAQGVAWFEGNLSIVGQEYYNTFIATRSISTGGSNKIYAPNYAGYSGTVGGTQYAPTGVCENSYFPTLYPKQFCDKANKKYLADADNGVGNSVFIVGSVPAGTAYSLETYVGGNITTGGGSELFGNLLAGNEFWTTGDTTIHGYSVALAAGANTHNAMTGRTTYNLKGLPATFDPTKARVKKLEGNGSGNSGTSAFKVKWATYR